MPAPFQLNILNKSVAYSDTVPSNNPMLRAFDWSRNYNGLAVSNPQSYPYYIQPGQSQLVFSGTRTTTLASNTAFTVSQQNTTNYSIYRFTFVSGTNPTLRTNRNLALLTGGYTVTVTQSNNQSATFTSSGGTPFSAVQVGDTLYLPGPVSYDGTSPFNTLNQGFWTVIQVSGGGLAVSAIRPVGTTYSGVAEGPITLTSNSQVQAYSQTGVQTGDSVVISAGFSPGTNGTYIVGNVTTGWFEITSTIPLAYDVAATPGVAGMIFYSFAKRFIRVEADQTVVVQLNGSSSTTVPMIAPIVPGDPNNVGWFEIWGPVYSLTVLNTSLSSSNVFVLSCE
jgi:hypothetical protein